MTALEVMRSYVEAMQRGDREAAYAHYAEDIVAFVPGRSAFAGELRGKGAVIGYIRAALAHAHAAELTLIDTLASEQRVALLVRERLEASDRVLDLRRANVYVVRDGKIVEISIFEGDQYAVDEFLAADRGAH